MSFVERIKRSISCRLLFIECQLNVPTMPLFMWSILYEKNLTIHSYVHTYTHWLWCHMELNSVWRHSWPIKSCLHSSLGLTCLWAFVMVNVKQMVSGWVSHSPAQRLSSRALARSSTRLHHSAVRHCLIWKLCTLFWSWRFFYPTVNCLYLSNANWRSTRQMYFIGREGVTRTDSSSSCVCIWNAKIH